MDVFSMPNTRTLMLILLSIWLAACDNSSSDDALKQPDVISSGGSFELDIIDDTNGSEVYYLAFIPDEGFGLAQVEGCDGELNGHIYIVENPHPNCQISAEFLPLQQITTNVSGSGTISPTQSSVLAGANTSFALSPDEGFGISAVSGCEGTLENNTYTLENVLADCRINASFSALRQVSINESFEGNDIAPPEIVGFSGEIIEVLDSQQASYTLTPPADHIITSVTGCDGRLEGNVYTTTKLNQDCSIQVNYRAIHRIEALSSPHGSIQPASALILNGLDYQFELSAEPGYTLNAISGCGGTLNGSLYTSGPITNSCQILANFVPERIVSTVAGRHGSISPSMAKLADGDQTSFVITPDLGYSINSVTGCNGTLAGNIFSTNNVTSDCTITASFIAEHTVSTSAGANGNISPSTISLRAGESASFTLNPDSGYGVANISGCGGTLSGMQYQTENLSADCQINVEFAPEYTVTSTASPNGVITPLTQTVIEGGIAAVEISANSGFAVTDVSGCNGFFYAPLYITDIITSDCTITTNFSAEYTVTAITSSNGNISPSNVTSHEGQQLSFELTPDAGFAIDTVSGCAGTLVGSTYTTASLTGNCSISASFIKVHTITSNTGFYGSITPTTLDAPEGISATFTITPDAGYTIHNASGCGGTLTGNNYETAPILGPCEVSATYLPLHTVSTTAGSNGSISPSNALIKHGESTSFTLTPEPGFAVESISGCNGSLNGDTYTTGTLNSPCSISATFTTPITAATPALSYDPIKTLSFTWTDTAGASHYKLLEKPDGDSSFSQVGSNIAQGTQSYAHLIPLHLRANAEYILQTCTAFHCSNSAPLALSGNFVNMIGYFKASNANGGDEFGSSIAISQDGTTLAIGAFYEDSDATGINGDESNNDNTRAGAVYIFQLSNDTWVQQAYLKASNSGEGDEFGTSLSMSADGNRLAVGAPGEQSDTNGIGGDQTDNNANHAGAVYVFTRSNNSWTQQAYLKASNSAEDDRFGIALALSDDGTSLAVGADGEESAATVIHGDQANNDASAAGAVYLFEFSVNSWAQTAYIKSSNAQELDLFGSSLDLDADGDTLAVGAYREDHPADSVNNGGAIYIFAKTNGSWSQEAYITTNNPGSGDSLGENTVKLSADGNTLAAGARTEDSPDTTIDGDDTDNTATNTGAAYLFTRHGGIWTQSTYFKASNAEDRDFFGSHLDLNDDGTVLAVTATSEDSYATGVNGDQTNDPGDAEGTGAVYLFKLSNGVWEQIAYLKATNTDYLDAFGKSLALSGDGQSLAIASQNEDSNATTIGGNHSNNSASKAGAVYLY